MGECPATEVTAPDGTRSARADFLCVQHWVQTRQKHRPVCGRVSVEPWRNLADYLNRVAYRGESFILFRGRRPVAELRPALVGAPLTELPGLVAGLPRLAAADAADFADDLASARRELEVHPPVDPWTS